MPKPPLTMTVDQFNDWRKTGRFPDEGQSTTSAPPPHRFAGLARGQVSTRGRMNRTEEKWAAELEALRLSGVVFKWWYEPMRLRLTDPAPGQRAVYFCPDFLVQCTDGGIYVDDVKGGAVNDASIVRIKAAATKFSLWSFRIVKKVPKRDGTWLVTNL